MKRTICLIGIAFAVLYGANPIYSTAPNGQNWPTSPMPAFTATDSQYVANTKSFSPSRSSRSALPVRVDNSTKAGFRPVFNQKSGSCAQSSGIAYAFTYEINTARNVSGSVSDNQYPYFFTYNFIVGDGSTGTWYFDGFEIAKANGIPNASSYGGFDSGDEYQWANGYEIYYNSMKNKASDYYKISDVNTESGLTTLKQWMYDHGRGDASGGVAVFSAMAYAAWNDTYFDKNGEFIIKKWGNSGYHAMTFAGYDDTISTVDINGDGKYTTTVDVNGDGSVDMKDWERGALKIVNSWGEFWGKSGTAWFAYSALATYTLNYDQTGDGGILANEVWVVDAKPVSTPTRTLKVAMQSTCRGALKMYVGAATSPMATVPEKTVQVKHMFNSSGGNYPLQNQTVDTLQFGLDLTSVTESLATVGTVRRYFLVVEGTYPDAAQLKFLSMIDYTSGTPVETPSNHGEKTIGWGTYYFPIDVPTATNTHSITATASGAGTISPSGSVSVQSGSSQTFDFTPSTDGKLDSVQVDGATIGISGTSYTFSAVSSDHSIMAFFSVFDTTFNRDTSLAYGIDSTVTEKDTSFIDGSGDTVVTTTLTYYNVDSSFISTDTVVKAAIIGTDIDTILNHWEGSESWSDTLKATVAILGHRPVRTNVFGISSNPVLNSEDGVRFTVPNEVTSATVVVLDVTGNIVFEGRSSGLPIEWNLCNHHGLRVSGSFTVVEKCTLRNGTTTLGTIVLGVQK